MGVEMVAFSNTQGGMLIIGVNDKTGEMSGLSFEEIQQTNALLVNAASENVKPAIPDEMIIHKNEEINDTVNFGVNENQKQILKFISENSQITAGEMAYKMKQTKRNVEYNIKVLKSKGIIERFGSDKTGGYRIATKEA